MNKQIFTAITIGPIYDTMELVSRPAGLWAASNLFSWIAKELMTSLHKQGCIIVSPWVIWEGDMLTLSECEKMRRKGVGLLHDRIFLEGDVRDQVQKAIDTVEKKLTSYLHNRKWIHEYLRIYAVTCEVSEGKNPITEMGQLLDGMELEPNYVVQEEENPLLKLFENLDISDGTTGGANDKIKNSFLVKEAPDWMLFSKRDKIRDLPDIAHLGIDESKLTNKYQDYYAILKMDGDNMGSTLAKLTSSEIENFSRRCLYFCADASEKVLEYGGMPIYAGGDDLLAIVPVIGNNSRDLFKLIQEIRELFNTEFKNEQEAERAEKNGAPPTVSFGVAIQYIKSPLYEALKRADQMLHNAKDTQKKNALFLDLQKHSGQSCQISVMGLDQSNSLKTFQEIIQQVVHEPVKDNDEKLCVFLSNAGHQIEKFKALFYEAIKQQNEQMIHNLMKNLFDNTDQAMYKGYLNLIDNLLCNIMRDTEPLKIEAYYKTVIDRTQAMLRFIHFLLEKRGEKEGGNRNGL